MIKITICNTLISLFLPEKYFTLHEEFLKFCESNERNFSSHIRNLSSQIVFISGTKVTELEIILIKF